MTAEDIMDRDFVCVRPDMSLQEAADLMTEHNCLFLPVIDDEGGACGVLLEADLLRAVMPRYLDGLASLKWLPDAYELSDANSNVEHLTVKDVIDDRQLYTVQHDAGPAEIAHAMLTKAIAGVGVEKDGKLVGYVTRAELVSHIYAHTLCPEETQQQGPTHP
jgi:CBS domain-containing protein